MAYVPQETCIEVSVLCVYAKVFSPYRLAQKYLQSQEARVTKTQLWKEELSKVIVS